MAEHCSTNLHRHFAEQLSKPLGGPRSGSASPPSGVRAGADPTPGPEPQQAGAAANCSSEEPSKRQDVSEDADGPSPSGGSVGRDGTQQVVAALKEAFQRTDQALAGTDAGDYVGATAVVAVLGERHIYIAHVGKLRTPRGALGPFAFFFGSTQASAHLELGWQEGPSGGCLAARGSDSEDVPAFLHGSVQGTRGR